jgi:hypothetical protein
MIKLQEIEGNNRNSEKFGNYSNYKIRSNNNKKLKTRSRQGNH